MVMPPVFEFTLQSLEQLDPAKGTTVRRAGIAIRDWRYWRGAAHDRTSRAFAEGG